MEITSSRAVTADNFAVLEHFEADFSEPDLFLHLQAGRVRRLSARNRMARLILPFALALGAAADLDGKEKILGFQPRHLNIRLGGKDIS